MLSFLLNSCKKDTNRIIDQHEKETLTNKIKQYLNDQNSKVKNPIGDYLDWNTIEILESHENNKIISIKYKADNIIYKDPNSISFTYGIFLISNGKVSKTTEVNIYGLKIFLTENLSRILKGYQDKAISDFDGNIIVTNLFPLFSEVRYFSKGKLFKTQNYSSKNENSTTGLRGKSMSTGGCIYTYAVTRVDGVITDVQFLFKSCNGGGTDPCQLPTFVRETNGEAIAQMTSTDCGGGGSGSPSNGGNNDPDSRALQLPDDPIMPGENGPAADPKKMVECYKNIPDAGATFSVIIQVQEPIPGTSFNYDPIKNGVGHTAITLIKTGPNGQKVTQTFGFYPAANKIKGPSKIVDNATSTTSENVTPTISMTYNVTSAQSFDKILTKIANPPATYELFGMNCTKFVVNACSAGGITLPNAITTINISGPPLYAMTPGGLGYEMRRLKSNGETRVNSEPKPVEVGNGECN